MKKIATFLLFCGFLFAKNSFDLILTYTVVVKDDLVVNEDFAVSKSMTKTDKKGEYLCSLEMHEDIDDVQKNKQQQIDSLKNGILECLLKSGAKINHQDFQANYKLSSKSFLILPPTRVRVDMDEDFANIFIIR
ncbi:MAG: hypothetical protein HXX81_01785 [Campylobacterales bacterium]|nr:hypothetical protein [Campylobacterales bacterium]